MAFLILMEEGMEKYLGGASTAGGAHYRKGATAKPHISMEQTRRIDKLYFFSSLTHLLVATIGQTNSAKT